MRGSRRDVKKTFQRLRQEPVLWLQIRIGTLFRSFVDTDTDPDPHIYCKYRIRYVETKVVKINTYDNKFTIETQLTKNCYGRTGNL